MSFVPNFTVALAANASTLTVTDTSTGTDGSINSRRIYLQAYDGTYIVPTGTTTNYIVWPLMDGSTEILTNILSKDYALSITVQWLSSSPAVLYSKNILYDFPGNAKIFGYQLSQYQSANEKLTNSKNYFLSKAQLWVYIKSSENAIQIGSDIGTAQLNLDAAKYLIDNPQLFH